MVVAQRDDADLTRWGLIGSGLLMMFILAMYV